MTKSEQLDEMVVDWYMNKAGMHQTLFEYIGLSTEEYCHWVATDEVPEGWYAS